MSQIKGKINYRQLWRGIVACSRKNDRSHLRSQVQECQRYCKAPAFIYVQRVSVELVVFKIFLNISREFFHV